MSWSSNDQLDKKIAEWLKWDLDLRTKSEVHNMIKEQQWQSLSKRLLNRLTFGTAGLRGCMRAGFNSVNELVIIQTAQGLCDYVLREFPLEYDRKVRGIVLGYDGRYSSKRFVELTACIFLHYGIKVWMFSSVVPTPFVPFAILYLKCLVGVMVTASHNPKEDNGYKVYWANGAQIIPPRDDHIQLSITEHLEPLESSWKTELLRKDLQVISDPYSIIIEAYYLQLQQNIPALFIATNKKSDLRFVYTAMHGVGYPFVKKAFKIAGLSAVVAVTEQQYPDPDFPTVKFPNPEEGKSSLQLSIAKADEEGINIILANDPDADRIACAEKVSGVWKIFTGNELGALLGWWSVKNYLENNPGATLTNCYMIASTVSSKILRAMSLKEGFQFVETLTGFKWMANAAIDLMAKKTNKVLFAFEEAIGFMFTSTVLDKDGVSAACHLATMASYLQAFECKTLEMKLRELYEKYGYHCTSCSYLFCYDPLVIHRIFDRLRHYKSSQTQNTYPESILNGEFPIANVRDLTTGIDTSMTDCRTKLPILDNNQMITFTFDNGLVVTLRTSGTEPKIKCYAELCATPDQKDWEHLQQLLSRMVTAIIDEFLQPLQNGLTAKED